MGGFNPDVASNAGASPGTGPIGAIGQGQVQNPDLTNALDVTIQQAERLANSNFDQGQGVAYTVGEVLNDPNLTQAQKDEYVARLVEIAGSGGHTTPEGLQVTPQAAAAVRMMFESAGDAWTGSTTPELRQQIAESIGRGVNSGRISADDLFAILDPQNNPLADGARLLLSEVTDGAVLNQLAGRMLDGAQAIGLRGDDAVQAVQALTSAIDVANMAAARGYTASANAAIDLIGLETANGPIFGDVSITDAMMLHSLSDRSLQGTTGFEALSTLLNSATVNGNAQRQLALDNLFGELVRSGEDRTAGGMNQSRGVEEALSGLGEYFNANLSRLMEQDLRSEDSGSALYGLVQDFTRNVALNPRYTGMDASADAISTELARLATNSVDPNRTPTERADALVAMGGLMGSVQGASERFVSDAGLFARGRVDAVRMLTDRITGSLTSRGGAVGEIVGGGVVDAFWNGFVARAEAAAQERVEGATGGLVSLGESLRAGLGEVHSLTDLRQYSDALDAYVERLN